MSSRVTCAAALVAMLGLACFHPVAQAELEEHDAGPSSRTPDGGLGHTDAGKEMDSGPPLPDDAGRLGTGDGGCIPFTCSDLHLSCGSSPDGCGATISCGGCVTPPPATCVSGDVLRTFLSAGSCPFGSCEYSPEDQVCPFGCRQGQCAPCVPKSCGDVPASCGRPSDGCGAALWCGSCSLPDTCGGGGQPFSCGQGTWGVVVVVGDGMLGPALGGTSDTDVWVGFDGGLLRGNGSSWTPIATPAPFGNLIAFAANQALGASYASGFVWDGNYWNPTAEGGGDGWVRIWGASVDDFWLAGSAGLWHCPSPTDSCTSYLYLGLPRLNWIWGSGPTEVWAAGFSGAVWSSGDGPIKTPASVYDSFYAVGGAGDDVWVGGLASRLMHLRKETGAWDFELPDAGVDFAAIWGNAPGDVWAAGGNKLFHWNGTVWEQDSRISGSNIQALWGPGPGSIWVLVDSTELWHLGP